MTANILKIPSDIEIPTKTPKSPPIELLALVMLLENIERRERDRASEEGGLSTKLCLFSQSQLHGKGPLHSLRDGEGLFMAGFTNIELRKGCS